MRRHSERVTINDVKAQNRIKIMKKIRNSLKHPPFKKIIILQKVKKKRKRNYIPANYKCFNLTKRTYK